MGFFWLRCLVHPCTTPPLSLDLLEVATQNTWHDGLASICAPPPPTPPPPLPPPRILPRCHRRIHDGPYAGVRCSDSFTKGRLEGCEIWGHEKCGVYVEKGGDPTLVACTIRDHAESSSERGRGVLVAFSAAGLATVSADCVFARNAGGDVVREEAPQA